MMKVACAILAMLALVGCRGPAPAPDKKAIVVPKYETMHPVGHGAIFHFVHEGSCYLACSMHQGGMAKGIELTRKGQKGPVVVGDRIHFQQDLHVWTFQPDTLSAQDALAYRKDAPVAVGDRIYILNKGKKIAGEVTAVPQGEGNRFAYKMDKPFPAGGMSGSPIFSGVTGTVIGVLQTANSKTAATFGGFERIVMP